jgi:hypothetical protein
VLDEMRISAPVIPLTGERLHLRARRPRNGCLESARVGPLRPWREALHDWARAVTKPTGA